MSVPVLTFFNNKGGVGKTSLVYHLSHMFAEMGRQVVALDLDPQANLTSAFMDEDALAELWNNHERVTTIYRAVRPLTQVGDIAEPELVNINARLNLVPGDVALAGFEEQLAAAWPDSMGDSGPGLFRPFRLLSAFWIVAQRAAEGTGADLILVDVGPNLGAINRSSLIASDFVAIPLAADLFSLQGLENLGPTLRSWRSQWGKREDNWRLPEFALPAGQMQPLGYLVQQHSVRLDRPVKAYDKWMKRIPQVYRKSVLEEREGQNANLTPDSDPHCLAELKHYRSLIPMAQEKRKPIFKLTPADGAIGNHAQAVVDAYSDFEKLAASILLAMEQPRAQA